MANLISEAILWIVIGIYAYWAYKANKAFHEYERKAQRSVEAVEGWRDMRVDEIVDEFMESDDHA